MERKDMTRRSSRLSRPAVALAVALAVNLVAATPVAAADVNPPELVDVTLSTSAVTVAGLAYESVTISIHLTDDDTGIERVRDDVRDFVSPSVVLSRGGLPFFWGDVRWPRLTSGTSNDGVWTAEFLVPSSYHGSWRVVRVGAVDLAGNELVIDPARIGIERTLEVTGTHRPQLGLRFTPNPATVDQAVTARGRLIYRDTLQPIPGQVVYYGFNGQCGSGGQRVTTNANGEYSFPVPRDIVRLRFPICVDVVAPVRPGPTFDRYTVARIASAGGKYFGFPWLRALVTAMPARRSVALGGRIRIDGNVRPNLGGRVFLLRQFGRQWVREGSVPVRASGRYTIYATPPARGTFRYRVDKPGSTPLFLVGGTSQVMILVAT